MEIIDIGRKDGTCPKCHIELSTDEKRSRVPICTRCIAELAEIFKDNIDMDGIEEFSDNVTDFADFVSSSARLMGLEDIVVVQVCFNVYMDGVREMADSNPTMARRIFRDTKRFIDIELERLEDSGEEDLSKDEDRERGKYLFEKMIGSMGKMMKDRQSVSDKTDDTKSGMVDINNKKSDDTLSYKDDVKKDVKEESKSVSKRIRVD